MRAVASEVGVATTSSLYWRVRNRDELLALAVDAVLAEALDPEATERDSLESFCTRTYTCLTRHEWVAPLLAAHAGTGPGFRAIADRLVELIGLRGVAPDQQAAALTALSHYVVGAAIAHAGWNSAERAGASVEEWVTTYSTAHPTSASAAWMDAAGRPHPTRLFSDGLALVLAGVDAGHGDA